MREDKMRYEFEAWLFKGHDLPAQSISYTAEELLFKLWSDLKACAAIKDAEIAEQRELWKDLRNVLESTQKEVAALELSVKELREAADDLYGQVQFLYQGPDDPVMPDELHKTISKLEKILAKTEHHDSRALEKMAMAPPRCFSCRTGFTE